MSVYIPESKEISTAFESGVFGILNHFSDYSTIVNGERDWEHVFEEKEIGDMYSSLNTNDNQNFLRTIDLLR